MFLVILKDGWNREGFLECKKKENGDMDIVFDYFIDMFCIIRGSSF